MKRTALLLLTPLALLMGCQDETPTQVAPEVSAQFAKGGRAGALGTVYVTGQGLWYDTFVSASSLPMQGRFQKLEGNTTEFGPGDPGYLGGRWWIDDNGNNMQDEGDTFLLCPLLPPGRATP
jgi:hypothetical protein